MRVRPLYLVVAGLLATTIAAPAAAQIQADFPEVVIFATNSIQVDQNVTVVTGDVVANNSVIGPTLVPGFELAFGNKASTPAGWEVKANRLLIGNFATIAGAVFCNTLVDNTGTVTCSPLNTAVYTKLPLFKTGPTNTDHRIVGSQGVVNLTPGTYGDISVGLEGTINFTQPGVYNVRSITTGRKSNINFVGATEVRVAQNMSHGIEGNINLAGPSANQVVFYVNGTGGAVLGGKSNVNANFYVKNGLLDIPSNLIAVGAFLGKDVKVGQKASVTLNSFFVNLPPNAVNDAATVTEDDPATTIDVLANDSDPNGDAIAIQSVTQPAGGAVVITNGGADLTYQPNANFCNDGSPTDNFNYTVCDNSTAINGNNCSTATVAVTVTCVNDPPVANDDAYDATEDTQLVVAAPGVLGNDIDVDSTITVSASDSTSANGGAVSVAADGSFTYTPFADFCGLDNFGYTASDGEFTDTATVTIDVACVNDAPEANDDEYNATEDTQLVITAPGVLSNDTDTENDPLSVSAFDSASANGGAVSVAADGSFTYDPALNFCGDDTFGYTASDGFGTGSATVTIHVACVNDPPVANNDFATTDQGVAVVIPVLANDSDPDNDPLTVVLASGTTTGGTISTNGTTITFTPNPGFSGVDRFGYQACDPSNACAGASVEVTVNDVNEAPIAAATDAFTNGDVNVQITLSATDPDGGQLLTFSLETAPQFGALTGLPASDTSPASVVVTYDPNTADDVEDSFEFRVTDPDGLFDIEKVEINSTGDPNEDPPDLGDVVAKDLLCNPLDPDDCEVEALQGQTKITILLQAAAPCDPTGAPDPTNPCDGVGNDVPLTFSLPSLTTSQGGTLSNLVQGTENPRRTATVDYLSPNSAFTGKDSFTFTVEGDVDGIGGIDQPNETDTGTVEINVSAFSAPAAVDAGPDRAVGFRDQTPVEIDLATPPAQDATDPPHEAPLTGAVSRASASGSGNGVGSSGAFGPAPNVPLTIGGGWNDFIWGGTIPVFATDDPSGATFDFTLTGNGCVSVTDDFDNGDQFRLHNGAQVIGQSTPVAKIFTGSSVGPDNAFADPSYSSGTFALAAGTYSISVEVIGESFTGGRGYIRVDNQGSGKCVASPNANLTIVEFSAPRSIQKDTTCGSSICYSFGKSIRVVVANTGNASSSGGSIGLYVSTDKTVTTGDTLLIGGRESVPALAPGQSAQITLNGTNGIPDTVAAGSIFLGAVIDEFNAVAEISETDNTASQRLLYGAQKAFTIGSLPQGGSLSYKSFNPDTGQAIAVPITSAPFTLPFVGGQSLTAVTYTPGAGTVSDGFSWSVSNALSTDSALVNLTLVASALGNCETNSALCDDGRNGGQGPQTQGMSPSEIDAAIDGPRFMVKVEGSGSVSTSRRRTADGDFPGLACDASCGGDFPSGSAVVLYARPVGSDSEFVAWEGDCSGTGPVAVTYADRDTLCIAVFRSKE